jgi:hypothetical protein
VPRRSRRTRNGQNYAAAENCRVNGCAFLHSPTANQQIGSKKIVGERSFIVIDALDEVAAKRDGDTVDLVLQKLGALSYPRFILSCRVADWRSATSVEAVREQDLDGPLQLHLDPLRRVDQLEILAAKLGEERAEVLVEHFERYGLDFLGNPQTLDMIARLPSDRSLPTSRGELFDQAIDVLRVEHRNDRGGAELAREAALNAAGATFAALILTGNTNIVRHGSANLGEGDLPIVEVEELGGGNIARVIDTRLFAGRSDSFTYWHRRIGEFLGAAWLAKRANTSRKRRRLLQLFLSHGLVPASLRGLHAWLARDPCLSDSVIAADPLAVIEYGDADTLTLQQARAMFAALRRVAGDRPNFSLWRHVRARGLVSSLMHHEADLVLRDKTVALGLRALVADQLSEVALAEQFRNTLRYLLLNSDDVFSIRRLAGQALTNLSGEDWHVLIDDLRIQGDSDGKRLAFELMQEMGCRSLSDTQVVEVVLAYDGLTALPWPRQRTDGLTVRFWRFADKVPIDRLDGILDTLTDYVRELMPEPPGIQEHDLIRLSSRLILHRLDAGFVEPVRLLAWLSSLQLDYESEEKKKVASWIEANCEVRRAIHRSVVFDGSEKQIWWKVSQLTRVCSGLAVNEGDAVALLGELDPVNRADTRWRDVLLLIPHDDHRGEDARQAALPFVAHDSQLRDWLDRLPTPPTPEWKIKHDAKERQRAAKRAVRIAEHRRHFVVNLQNVRLGEFRFVHQLAKAYLNLIQDESGDAKPHERVAKWLGEDVAEAAHQGFDAFLTRHRGGPSALRIAVSVANRKRYGACDIIVAAFAERLRTRAEPFVDLSTERLMAGVFELWNSNIHDFAGLPDLRERIETELKTRGAWEGALRLYLVPQLKRRLPDGFLSSLMTSDVDAPLAAALAADWLRSCPDLLAEAEEAMIDRLIHSPRRAELCEIGNQRRMSTAGDDNRRRNWDAVQVLVDFEAASGRLGNAVEPNLLWHLRKLSGEGRIGHRVPIKMRPSQLVWVVATFRKSWLAQYQSSGVSWGDETPRAASDYLSSLVSRLGDDTSSEAIVALDVLRDMPQDGYTDHIREVAAEQRQKLVERAYTPPTIQQIKSILDAGPPADSADLQAVMMDALETAQRWLRGNDVDWYRGFFQENGRHKTEELCRDEIIKMLRAIDNSLEYIPETHVADDKRVDIVVRGHDRLILPIEVKGQWHADLWTAADKQLDYLYVNDWRAERGIYLVLWFGEDVRQPRLTGKPKPATARELCEELRAANKAALAGRVDIVVLDLTRPGSNI